MCGLLLLLLGCASCASYVEKDLRRYVPSKKGETREYELKNLRIRVASEPSRYDPALVLVVERQKVPYLYRKVMTQRFRVWDDGRPKEEVQGSLRTRVETLLVPEPTWFPFPGQKVKVRISGEEEVRELTTDEQGRVSIDVSPFAHLWIEDRELAIEYRAILPTYESIGEGIWETFREKRPTMPDFVKALGKVQVGPREGRVVVRPGTLERIFR